MRLHATVLSACAGLVTWLAADAATGVEPAGVAPTRDAMLQLPAHPQLQSLRAAAPGNGPFAPATVPSLDGSPVEYLILTSDAMAPAFERLAAWKTAKGVPAVVRTLSQVEAAGGRGSDLAETLRLYIRDAYVYWGARWVLLGGDTDIIPARYVTGEFLGLADPLSDLYYSCLDGDWNADGDAYFGEAYVDASDPGDDADFVSEVYLGRAPVSTRAEADLFVDKTLAYEKPTVLDFQDKALFLAEVLFPADYSPEQPISIDGATFAEDLRPLLPPALQLERLYETYEYYPGSHVLRVDSATTRIDAGQGTIVHIGHGYRYTLSMGNGSADVGLAAAYSNGVRSGLFYMLNCTAAAFDFESFAEALILNPNGGATLVIGAAREAFPLAARDYQYEFFRHLYTLGERRAGEAMTRSRQEFVATTQDMAVDRWTQLVYVLLGDPEASIWAANPRSLQLQGLPASFGLGSQSVAMQVRDAGGVLRGALVCAAKDGEEYRAGRSDSLGNVVLQLEPRTTGDVHVTVTAPDHLPLELAVPVSAPSRALVLAGSTLLDDGAGVGSGNTDGRWDAGETARLGISLRNEGNQSVQSLQATLESTDAAVQVLQAAATYGSVAPQQTASIGTPFVVRAGPGTPDGSLATLTLHLQHANGSETRRVDLLVHAARLDLVALRLDDRRAGNGDGVQDPGEEIDLHYTLSNRGSGAAQQVRLRLAALESGLEVLADSASVPDIAPGASAESARLALREADVSLVHRGQLVLRHLQDARGAARRIDLRPPLPPAKPTFLTADQVDAVHVQWTRSGDLDLQGYHVLRATVAGGPFAPADAGVVRPSYFGDRGLRPSTRYYYRIVAVDSTLLESTPGPVGSVSTNPPQKPGWPLPVNDRSSSSLGIADVNGDGKLDVVGGARQIYAWDAQGDELVDADHSATTWGLFYGTAEAFGSITVADLDPQPGKEIVAATWDATARYVVVLHGDGTPLAGWPRPLRPAPPAYRGSSVAPVVANLDASGAPEILLAARDGRLYGWHADGTEIADGDHDPTTQGVLLDTGSPFLSCAPAVADLDPARTGYEIVLGGTNGTLYALDADGAALAGWPRTTFGAGTPFGGSFRGGASIGDLDRDGRLEIVILDGNGRLHALHLDGSEQPGFPVSGIQSVTQSVSPSPALGDLLGDEKLEIVAAGTDGKVYLIDASGAQRFPGGPIESGANTESSPILGDADGDAEIEVILGNEQGMLHAWNLDGTAVVGFPISLGAEVRGTPTLCDLDGDGICELALLGWNGLVQVWDLGVPWNAARAPWPTYRGNVHRTGEYGYLVPTPVQLSELRAEWEAPSGVRLRWRAAASGPDIQVLWRVYRAGPLDAEPLGTADGIPYNVAFIGAIRGTGNLEFVDPGAEPGSWYVYSLGSQEQRRGGGESAEVRAGSIAVRTATTAPTAVRLLPNAPNPFNPATRLRFEVPGRGGESAVEVRLVLYDAQGRRVRELLHAALRPGEHAVAWDGRDGRGIGLPSGVYVARLDVAGRSVTRKLTLVR